MMSSLCYGDEEPDETTHEGESTNSSEQSADDVENQMHTGFGSEGDEVLGNLVEVPDNHTESTEENESTDEHEEARSHVVSFGWVGHASYWRSSDVNGKDSSLTFVWRLYDVSITQAKRR